MNALVRQKLPMIDWKSDEVWVERLCEFPDVMKQGRRLKEFKKNLRHPWRIIALDAVRD